MKNLKFSIVFLVGLLWACDDAADEVTPENPQSNAEPVNVLVDNSGYSHIFDDVRVLSSASAFQPYIGVLDYTLESGNKFHLAYFTSQPTQQDDIRENERVTVNVDTREEIELPSAADTLAYSPVELAQKGRSLFIQQFRPYSNSLPMPPLLQAVS